MAESFKLKPGQQIFLHSEHKIIHEKNLESDEQAIELLAKNKNLIAGFAEYPEDWEERVDALLKSKAEKTIASIPAPQSESGEPVAEKTIAPGKNHTDKPTKAKGK